MELSPSAKGPLDPYTIRERLHVSGALGAPQEIFMRSLRGHCGHAVSATDPERNSLSHSSRLHAWRNGLGKAKADSRGCSCCVGQDRQHQPGSQHRRWSLVNSLTKDKTIIVIRT